MITKAEVLVLPNDGNVVEFTYTQSGHSFLNKTTYHPAVKVDGVVVTPARGSKSDTLVNRYGYEQDSYTRELRVRATLVLPEHLKKAWADYVALYPKTPKALNYSTVDGSHGALIEYHGTNGRLALRAYQSRTLSVSPVMCSGNVVPTEKLKDFLASSKSEPKYLLDGHGNQILDPDGNPITESMCSPKFYLLDGITDFQLFPNI